MYDPTQFKQNLFSANHRNAMMQKYGYTSAQAVTVDDLMADYTFEQEYEPLPDHDCHLSENDPCKGCEAIYQALNE